MGLSYKYTTLPSTLREGEFAVVNGVTYVGNSDNEPKPAKGYRELIIKVNSISETVFNADIFLDEFGGAELVSNNNYGITISGISAQSALLIANQYLGSGYDNNNDQPVLFEYSTNGQVVNASNNGSLVEYSGTPVYLHIQGDFA